MCTRFALKTKPEDLQKLLGLEQALDWKPRYNLAPSQSIPAVIRPLENKKRELRSLRWGFHQTWAQGGRLLVNARSEDIQDKPFFQGSFEKWRCLIPMDGFYEWRHEGKETRPHYIHMTSQEPFAVAGIWSPQEEGKQTVDCAAVLTTQSNFDIAFIHDRMPVILRPQDFEQWLDVDYEMDFEKVKRLMKPFREGLLESHEVGDWVNSPANDNEKCIERYNGPSTLSLPF